MKKVLTITAILLLLIVLDNSVLPFFAINGVVPNLIFAFAISFSIINGYWSAILVGIMAGVLQDIYFINAFGINALTNMLVCLLAAKTGESIYKDSVAIPVISTFFFSVVKNILVLILLSIINVAVMDMNVLYNSLYNMVIEIPVYILTFKLSNLNYMKREWRF